MVIQLDTFYLWPAVNVFTIGISRQRDAFQKQNKKKKAAAITFWSKVFRSPWGGSVHGPSWYFCLLGWRYIYRNIEVKCQRPAERNVSHNLCHFIFLFSSIIDVLAYVSSSSFLQLKRPHGRWISVEFYWQPSRKLLHANRGRLSN